MSKIPGFDFVEETLDTFPSGLHKYSGDERPNDEVFLKDNSILNTFITAMMERIVPTGTILQFGGKPEENNDPPGFLFLLPGGREVSRETYANLFSVIGTTFDAGDGKTTFKLPDLAGRFPLGYDANLGSKGGSSEVTLSISETPKHRHGLDISVNGVIKNTNYVMGRDGGTSGENYLGTQDKLSSYSAWNAMFSYVGGSQSHNNMPPYLALAYIIKI